MHMGGTAHELTRVTPLRTRSDQTVTAATVLGQSHEIAASLDRQRRHPGRATTGGNALDTTQTQSIPGSGQVIASNQKEKEAITHPFVVQLITTGPRKPSTSTGAAGIGDCHDSWTCIYTFILYLKVGAGAGQGKASAGRQVMVAFPKRVRGTPSSSSSSSSSIALKDEKFRPARVFRRVMQSPSFLLTRGSLFPFAALNSQEIFLRLKSRRREGSCMELT